MTTITITSNMSAAEYRAQIKAKETVTLPPTEEEERYKKRLTRLIGSFELDGQDTTTLAKLRACLLILAQEFIANGKDYSGYNSEEDDSDDGEDVRGWNP
jgi:hypothetical protein